VVKKALEDGRKLANHVRGISVGQDFPLPPSKAERTRRALESAEKRRDLTRSFRAKKEGKTGKSLPVLEKIVAVKG